MPKYAHLAQLPDDCQTLYMQKVGCRIHLATQSRPELMFSVTQLSRRNKKQHDVTCMQLIELYDMLLVHLLRVRFTVPMAYLLNCTPLLMFPTIAMQTRSLTLVSQYTTADFLPHLYPCPKSNPLSQTLVPQLNSLVFIQVHRQSCGHEIS